MSQPLYLSDQEYRIQDAILQYISSNFVSVKDSDMKYFKRHLEYLVGEITEKMKEVDSSFCTMFQRVIVAGSFWDKLKIGEPDEFDKNVVLRLPSCLIKHVEFTPAAPSFVLLNVNNGLAELKKSANGDAYSKIHSWLDRDGNIIADKVRFWMEGVVEKAVRALPDKHDDNYYEITCKKSGPAITVGVEIYPERKTFDIDIVPAFEFQPKDLPKHVREYKSADLPPLPWHVVPKPIRPNENKSLVQCGQTYPPAVQWRLSFHNQESHLLHNTGHLKAVLKLFKKMRDVRLDQNFLSSYAIKTLFLWENDAQDESFWRQSLSALFVHMLNVLNKTLRSGNLPFFWQKEHNLLEKLKPCQRDQLASTVQKICNQIQCGLQSQDWFTIARVILTEQEYHQIKEDLIIEEAEGKVVAQLRCVK